VTLARTRRGAAPVAVFRNPRVSARCQVCREFLYEVVYSPLVIRKTQFVNSIIKILSVYCLFRFVLFHGSSNLCKKTVTCSIITLFGHTSQRHV
jgi:hypothetical protein